MQPVVLVCLGALGAFAADPVKVPGLVCYWGCHGQLSRVYVGGRFVADEGRNPFPLPGGLFHGNADFTVGAVDRSGEIGNFLDGTLGGLAIYSRALNESELERLAKPNP